MYPYTVFFVLVDMLLLLLKFIYKPYLNRTQVFFYHLQFQAKVGNTQTTKYEAVLSHSKTLMFPLVLLLFKKKT